MALLINKINELIEKANRFRAGRDLFRQPRRSRSVALALPQAFGSGEQ
jgi:hypothetical protein